MKNIKYCAFILAFIFIQTSCSNLFESFLNSDGSLKSGDTRVTEASTGSTTSSTSDSSGTTDNVVANESPEAYYSNEDENESTNTEVSAGIVVIKSSKPSYNQIYYTSTVHDYEIGYSSADGYSSIEYASDGTTLKEVNYAFLDSQKNAREYSSSVYLNGEDDPVTIKVFKNDSNATVKYEAIQTRTTNIANGSLSTTFLEEGTEVFIDLDEQDQPDVSFTHDSESDGNPLVFTSLPYGTTRVNITIVADDDYYTDTYSILLNKRHILTSLMEAEENSETKTTLTTGFVVLKESDGYNTNQITYTEGQTDYFVGSVGDSDNANCITTSSTPALPEGLEALSSYTLNGSYVLLTSDDETTYVKAIPDDKDATVTWTAVQIAEPVYTYEYYKTVTTTIVKVDANGTLLDGYPSVFSETTEVSSVEEETCITTEETDSSGNTVTTTVTATTRKKHYRSQLHDLAK